jgi:transcriptional regulator with XRE-family HTH domain
MNTQPPAQIQFRNRDVARAFGLWLRKTRNARGIPQDVLSGLCDFDRTYPSLLERGLRSPSLAMVVRIATAVEVEPTVLVADVHNNLLPRCQHG